MIALLAVLKVRNQTRAARKARPIEWKSGARKAQIQTVMIKMLKKQSKNLQQIEVIKRKKNLRFRLAMYRVATVNLPLLTLCKGLKTFRQLLRRIRRKKLKKILLKWYNLVEMYPKYRVVNSRYPVHVNHPLMCPLIQKEASEKQFRFLAVQDYPRWRSACCQLFLSEDLAQSGDLQLIRLRSQLWWKLNRLLRVQKFLIVCHLLWSWHI